MTEKNTKRDPLKSFSLKTKAVVLEFGRFQLECETDTGLTAWKKSGLIELEEIVIGDESDFDFNIINEDHESWCSF